MGQCHCRDRQRSSGGPFVAVVVVPIEALKLLKGSTRFFDTPSDGGGFVHRGFCPESGSPVLAKFDPAPPLIGIRAGSLDGPSWFHPGYDTWTSDAQQWDQMNPAMAKFEKYPTSVPAAKPS